MNTPSRFRVLALASLSSLLILNSHGAPEVAEEIEVEFSFSYRATAQSEIEAKRFALKVPIVHGGVPEAPLGITGKAEFEGMSGTVLIGYNSIKIKFFGAKGLISETLFQMEKAPTNSFSGGHGFTGLHYVSDTSSNAQIQFFARVQDHDNKDDQGADEPAPQSEPSGNEKP